AMMLATQNTGNTQAVNYVGKIVTASGSRAELVNGTAQWNFAVEKAADVTISVRDMDGNVVFTKQGSVSQGESVFTWDGVGSDGRQKPDGSYSVTIEGRDADGKLVEVLTEM